MVDFPPLPHDVEDGLDAGSDARVRDADVRDGGRDSARADSSRGDLPCDITNHDGCGDKQLCCDREDGRGPLCIDTAGSDECSACGMACGDSKAPNCGARTCECEAGSGGACRAGQRCVGAGKDAHCVECMADTDCAARTDGKQQCVNNVCAQCDRGASESDSSDDQGCPSTTPICSASHTCESCAVSPKNNCPANMQCDPELGCSGCLPNMPVGQNGCGGTNPVCGTVTINGKQANQCRKCTKDDQCSGGYCVEKTGECVADCDPDQPPGANHCASPGTPICKQGSNGFTCSACTVAAECAGVTDASHCSLASGSCVQCRTNTDCNGTPATPVCSNEGTCRARSASDCGLQRFDPASKTCVECLPASQTVDCLLGAGPVCTSKNKCGECNTDAQCTQASAPICNTNTNRCGTGCTMDAQCANQTGTPHCDTAAGVCVACSSSAQCTSATAPLCSPTSKTCVACGMITPVSAADSACSAKDLNTPACITTGSRAGRCGGCDTSPSSGTRGCIAPTPVCDTVSNTCAICMDSPSGDVGCPSARSQCVTTPGMVACYACDFSSGVNANAPCPAGATCKIVGSAYACVSPPDAGVPSQPDGG